MRRQYVVRFGRHSKLSPRVFTRLPLTIAVFAALGLGGTTALAEPGSAAGQFDEIVLVDDSCEPDIEDCGDPDPEVNPDIPTGPSDFTDDLCEPAEEDCSDPDPGPLNPDIPPGPGDFTDDPCEPLLEDCGGPGPDEGPDPEPDPEPEPEPEPCELDDVCTRTPTFTG